MSSKPKIFEVFIDQHGKDRLIEDVGQMNGSLAIRVTIGGTPAYFAVAGLTQNDEGKWQVAA